MSDDGPRDRMVKAIRVCAKREFPASASGFLRAARAVERFCYPLALGFWPSGTTLGPGPITAVLPSSAMWAGEYAPALASARCARKAGVAVRGAALRDSLYTRRRALQAACAEVRVLTRDYDLDWLAKRVAAGLLGGKEL